jgi:23S rRNA (adenine2503-C2)-methyltransferase
MNAVPTSLPKSPGLDGEATDAPREALIGQSLEDLRALAREMGEPSFRADQLHHWLYVRCVRDFDAMTNLKKSFREKLAERFQVGTLTIAEKQVSRDGTCKYLFRLADGRVVESVLMYFEERGTYAVCLSTQVGCAVNCDFCATGKLGFSRNLSVAEIVEQYVYVQADSGREVRNIVFMGQGEPLLNYDNLMKAIRILNQSAEVGMRRITVSTSGILPGIEALAREDLQLTLAISLHAPDDETRERIMPINRKWPIAALMTALHQYVASTGKRLTVEYILLAGVNDQPGHAHALGRLLQGLKCNVNLIPYNPIFSGDGYARPSRNTCHRFREIVAAYGKKVTIRVERGVDIAAACGQLANQRQPGSRLGSATVSASSTGAL